MNYKVSVIIPIYNGSKYLQRSVQSALNLEEVGEIIIVDDGSSDDSAGMARQLASQNDKIKFFQHADKKNHGPAASRNIGIRNAAFDFIAFLDADDYYSPNRFKAEKEIFINQPYADGVYGCIQNVFENDISRELFYKTETDEIHGMTESVPPEKLFKALILFGYGRICLPAVTVKKDAVVSVGLFNENLRWSEDTELWLKLAIKKKLVGGDLKNPGCIRWVHEKNSIHQHEKAFQQRLQMYQYLLIWTLQQKCTFEVSNNIFNAYKEYLIKTENKTSEKKLFRKTFTNFPNIIFHSFFWKKLRLLYS